MALKAAIFDLDGTVLDSMGAWNRVDMDFMRDMGLRPRPDIQQAVMAMTLRQSAEYFRTEFSLPLTTEEIMARLTDGIKRAYAEYIPLKPGAEEALALLDRRGIAMAVATATESSMAESALRRLGIRDYFQTVCTCDAVGRPKTEPDVYLHAAAILRAAPAETLVFEDAPFAARTALRAGFRVAAVHDEVSARCGDMSFADIRLRDYRGLAEYLDACM